ncbi:MAG: hydroxymyristoyl-ACP dehydratase [Burkholderiales bacterium]|nr:hydroxymyristoyl-ACP dehydratase [Burkholderiales bacterium]MDE2157484.1 hydroxymyristoyl-ACP dehydratase [Burkholderiales bacterium]
MTLTSLDAAGIAARIPHRGTMCLLASMSAWSAESIVCHAGGQRDIDHPLRSGGVLHAACGVEYAAQAMALHGTLAAIDRGAAPRPGVIASLRGVTLHVARLDDIAGTIEVRAQRLAGDERQAQYAFTLRDAAARPLVEGRATVILDAYP